MTGATHPDAATHFFTPRRPISAHLKGRDGMEAMSWHSAIAADPAGFELSLDFVVFDNMALARTSLTPATVARTPQHVAALKAGSTFYFLISGRAMIIQDGRQFPLVPGAIAVASGHLPFDLVVPVSSQLITIMLRRNALDGRGVPSPETDIRVFTPSPFADTVSAFVTTLANAFPGPTSTQGVSTQQALLHLITGLLLDNLDDPPNPDRQEARVAHALTFIMANYFNPDLTTADVATATGISVRHLQRILTESHTSVAAELRRARLRWASVFLLQPDRQRMTIEEVARLTGFGNLERMRRAFLHDLGTTPADYRAAGLPPSRPGVDR